MTHIDEGPSRTPDRRAPSIRAVWIADRTGSAGFVTASLSQGWAGALHRAGPDSYSSIFMACG